MPFGTKNTADLDAIRQLLSGVVERHTRNRMFEAKLERERINQQGIASILGARAQALSPKRTPSTGAYSFGSTGEITARPTFGETVQPSTQEQYQADVTAMSRLPMFGEAGEATAQALGRGAALRKSYGLDYELPKEVTPGNLVWNPATKKYEQVGEKRVPEPKALSFSTETIMERGKPVIYSIGRDPHTGALVSRERVGEAKPSETAAGKEEAKVEVVKKRIATLTEENFNLGQKMKEYDAGFLDALNKAGKLEDFNKGEMDEATKTLYDQKEALKAGPQEQINTNEGTLKTLNEQIGGTWKPTPAPVTSTAKKVVRTGKDKKTGKKVIQYEDGTVEYAK